MNYKADLHLHTNKSDGKLSPIELVKLAKTEGLNYIAVTDHDTTEGTKLAIDTGNSIGVTVIPGIELSTQHNTESIHILGYFRDDSYNSLKFQEVLLEMKNYRLNRGKKIIENLDKYFNIKLDYEKVFIAAHGVIARPHIARAIIDAGYNYEWDYIFNKIIGDNSAAFVPNKKLSTLDGIELLRSVNATIILAHPVLIKKTDVDKFMRMDIDGLEAIYSQNSPNNTKNLLSLAHKHNKLVTAGSDFHGGDKGDTKHGYIGCIDYPQNYLDQLLKTLNYI